MSCEDKPEQEDPGAAQEDPGAAQEDLSEAPSALPGEPIPLIPPASQEPLSLLIFGLICFVMLACASWWIMGRHMAPSRHPERQSTEVYQISVEARQQTYLVELQQQRRLRKSLIALPKGKNSTLQVAKLGAKEWQQVADASRGSDKALPLLNVAALQGVSGLDQQVHDTLQHAEAADAQFAPVVRELLPLYAHPARALPFSAPTELKLKRLSSRPLWLARQAQVRGNRAGALAALQPGAAAGVRVIIFRNCTTLFFVGVLFAVLIIGVVKFPRITHHLQEVATATQPELPWGPGMALLLICLVFVAMSVLSGGISHYWHLKDEQLQVLVGAATEVVSAIIVLGAFLLLLGRKPWDWAVFGWQRSLHGVRFATLTLLCSLPLVWVATLLAAIVARQVGDDNTMHPLIPMLQNPHSSLLLQLALALLPVLMAPVVEETLFRGMLFRALGVRLPFWSAALSSGVLFGLIHGQLAAILPITILGITLAFILGRKHNLLACATAHGLSNGYVTVIALLSAWALHGPGG